jgi:hypothetical protein
VWYILYRSLVLCPHPWLTDCDIYFIVHLFYAHIHFSLSAIYIVSFTCSMLTSMALWLWYLFHRSLVLCSHRWLTDCDIFFIVHLFYVHIHCPLITLQISVYLRILYWVICMESVLTSGTWNIVNSCKYIIVQHT